MPSPDLPVPILLPALRTPGRSRGVWVGLCVSVVLMYLAIALLGALDLLPDYQLRVGSAYAPPAANFALLLGTDMFGRSVLYKLLAGTQTAIALAALVPAITVPVGVGLGAVAGYYGRSIDAAVVFLFSVVSALPEILLVLAISFLLGKGLTAIAVAMASVGWVSICRLVRAEVIKQRGLEYVLAARVLGASDARVLAVHVVPNVLHLVWVSTTLQMLAVIKFEVVLTYLGVGIQSGISWGAMISDAAGELVQGVWWPLAGVVVAMFGLIYALSVLGDALRDAFDPRL